MGLRAAYSLAIACSSCPRLACEEFLPPLRGSLADDSFSRSQGSRAAAGERLRRDVAGTVGSRSQRDGQDPTLAAVAAANVGPLGALLERLDCGALVIAFAGQPVATRCGA